MDKSREAPYTAPSHGLDGFNCPHCHAFAAQAWGKALQNRDGNYQHIKDLEFSYCRRCFGYSLWHENVLVFPEVLQTPTPNPDLSEEVRDIYREAEEIFNRSPRGAAALLR